MEDTIAAISTNLSGPAGIGIIRMSGENAIAIADRIFVSPSGKKLSDAASHTLHYGRALDENGQECDECLVSVMRAPHTYTREDVVEFNCHGGILVQKKVLASLISAGARPAQPGEFTRRAFLNGRIDLSQAEAVMDLINAKNSWAIQASVSQLDGRLSKELERIRDEILDHTARIEAALDDPEHMELENYGEVLEKDVVRWQNQIKNLISHADEGRILKEGIRTVILGRTNAGKSSLMNLLSGADRAIVTDVAGTTRDILEETVMVNGLSLLLMDTAGIRETADVVEKIGVNRAWGAVKDADLILYVVYSSQPIGKEDDEIMQKIQESGVYCIALLNKSDLVQKVTEDDIKRRIAAPVISFSAKTGDGLEELKKTLTDKFASGNLKANDQVIITSERHKYLLMEAEKSLDNVMESIRAGMSEDFFTIDLMGAYTSLGTILGREIEDDLADRIFSKFCMGK
jgi:tRNA modification GTPase